MAVSEGGGAGLCRGRADLCRWRACVRLAVLVPERLRGWFSLSEAEGWLFRHDAGSVLAMAPWACLVLPE